MTTAGTSRRCLDGRYQLQELIAVGGMGEVWRARDLQLHRSVAVKVLRSEYADDPVFVARFRSEARHAAALSHPNIAAVLDYGETTAEDTGERLAYLVMELVEGPPLSARLAEVGSLDTAAALSLLRQAAAGLAEAHRAGVVHRDVKPANILLGPDGTVKLTDFGISWSAGSAPITGTGQVVGTAQYMSPEQARGEHVSPASDVYALGLVGYESLTGHAAFDGDNPVTVALKQVQEHPEPLPAALPSGVRALIDAALVKDPAQRPRDGGAFLSAVEEAILRPAGTAPRRRPLVTRPVRAARPSSRGTRAAPGRAGRRPALAVATPLAAFLLLGGGALWVIPDPDAGAGRSAGAVSTPSAAAGVVLAVEEYLGRPAAEVAAELGALGLTVRQEEDVTAEQAPGTVTRLEPAAGMLLPGDQVRLGVAVRPGVTEPELPPSTGGGAIPVGRPEPVAPAPEVTVAEEPVRSAPASRGPAEESTGPARGATSPGGDAPEPSTPPRNGEVIAGPSTPPEGGGGTTEPTSPPEGDGGTTEPTSPPEGDGGTTEPTSPPEGDGGTTEPTTPPEGDGGTTEPTTPPEDDGDDGEQTAAPEEDDEDAGEQTAAPEDDDDAGEQTDAPEEDDDAPERDDDEVAPAARI
ncbi:protein kinase domain-containing protein [Blastococcus sp. SYSU DS1024]